MPLPDNPDYYLHLHHQDAADLYERARHRSIATSVARARRLRKAATAMAAISGWFGAAAARLHQRSNATTQIHA